MKTNAIVLTIYDAVHWIFLLFHVFSLEITIYITWYLNHLKNMFIQELEKNDETDENRISNVTTLSI